MKSPSYSHGTRVQSSLRRLPVKKHDLYIFLICLVLLLVLLQMYGMVSTRIKNMLPVSLPLKNSNPLKILIWTTRTSPRRSFYTVEKLGSVRCEARCDIIEDKEMVDVVDAIVVHGTQETGSDVILPPRKKWNQLRVFFRMESSRVPTFRHLPNEYNWTMTYRRDSDVPTFYGNFRQKSDSSISPQDILNLRLDKSPVPLEKLEELQNKYLPSSKTKLMAWTVSHCKTDSRREDLVANLQKFLTVDVYGGCGNFSCTKQRMEADWQSCYPELGRKYKFYLAFENSLCVDYVTEKLYEPLKNGMVPIVYGGVDYSLSAPPGSYIDALSFGSIEKLAKWILFLDTHPQEYLEYFLWLDHYEFYEKNRWCSFCTAMWEHTVLNEKGQWVIDPSYSQVNENISRWWFYRLKNGRMTTKNTFACQGPPTFF